MNILFVGAHPDDIESLAGGTASLYVRMGAKVFFCIMTNGNIGSSTLSKKQIREVRYEEAGQSAALIGAELIWLDFDDEFLFDNVQTRLALIEAFRIADPDVVFCHWKEDYNPDHSISGRMVDDCVHMASVPLIETETVATKRGIPHVYYMDTPGGVGFEPELYVDISETFEMKVEMIRRHKSQNQWMTDIYGNDMDAFLEVPASFRGFQAGCRYAEGFRPSQRWGRTFIQHYLPQCLPANPLWRGVHGIPSGDNGSSGVSDGNLRAILSGNY